jgi:hypothetical protein
VNDVLDTLNGEQKHGFAPWQADPHGRRAPLANKRLQRGWNELCVEELVAGLDPPVQELVRRGEEAFAGGLVMPWEEEVDIQAK